jgi:integrase
MRAALTDKSVAALKPNDRRYEVHDLHCPGLSVRVSTEGRKTFTVKYRYGSKQKRQTIGVYPRYGLAEARARAGAAMRQVDDGVDPQHRQRQADLKCEAVCGSFIELYAKVRNRHWRESERILEREFIPIFGQKEISEIRRPDVVRILDDVQGRGARYQANRTLATLRKLFNWCVERGLIEASPISGMKRPCKEMSRERVLKDDEIQRVLAACQDETYPFRQYLPFLLATGQRRAETAAMRWEDVDFDDRQWVIPAEKAKNGKAHVVPLSEFTLEILRDTPRFASSPYVFTTTRSTPLSGFSKALKRIAGASATEGWRLHDLRRTAASGMARASIPPHVIEKVLNHISGTISGVAAVYNRYGYDAEKREALENWGRRLDQITKATSPGLDPAT